LFDTHKYLFLSTDKREFLLYRTLEHKTTESGGKVSQKLVKNTFKKRFGFKALETSMPLIAHNVEFFIL